MESYLIKQVEPLHPRRRVYHRFSRPRLWSVDEKAGTLVSLSSANNNNSASVSTVVTATHQQGSQGSGGGPTSLGFIEEETTTDWQPEIPFENVRVRTTGRFFCRHTEYVLYKTVSCGIYLDWGHSKGNTFDMYSAWEYNRLTLWVGKCHRISCCVCILQCNVVNLLTN